MPVQRILCYEKTSFNLSNAQVYKFTSSHLLLLSFIMTEILDCPCHIFFFIANTENNSNKIHNLLETLVESKSPADLHDYRTGIKLQSL